VQWTQTPITVAETGGPFEQESRALERALGTVRAHLEKLCAAAAGEQRAILAAHVELVDDPELAAQARDALQRGKGAGFAWRRATRATIEALGAVHDERLRERAADLRDLENQVLRVLSGKPPASARVLPAGAIVLADELLPSQLAALDPARLAGICMARGGATSHVAIIAASLGIPALVAAGPSILAIAEGTALVLDAEHGHLHVDPDAAERAGVEQSLARAVAERATDLAAARGPAATLDGHRITVYANLGSLADAKAALAHGAEGCGLLRTEFLFLDRRQPPTQDEQARAYQDIATALEGRPLTIRTLDIGGDKPIAYLPLPREDNPALGLRGLRTSLWKPELLRTQLRAILRVLPLAQVRILLPMVTDVDELRTVRALIDEGRDELGIASAPALGVMIETPASALLAAQLAAECDFLSIGTNDLSQYTLAMDRTHPELAARLDALHPAVLRLIAGASDAARAAGKEVAVCGSLGSDAAAIPILVGLGVHEISAVPASIPRLKRAVRSLDLAACRALALRALDQPSARAVRALLGE
jgi:phosphoenolpyruvate-protein phosphotransferase